MESLEQTLRAVLTPITHRLPAPIEELATMLLGDSCYRSLVHNLTISDSVCMKLAVSKVLSLAIVAASSVVKVPQMIKLINSGSAEGISFIGYLLETASLMVTLVYNVRNRFPFSSFGETAFIVIQNVAICFLVLEYSGKGNMGTMLIAALAGVGFLLFNSDIVSAELLQYLQMGAGAVAALSKLPQIIAIFREGGTGQLSAFTVSHAFAATYVDNSKGNIKANNCSPTQVFSYLFGSLSRIFTTLQEVPDKVILYSFIAGFALNAVLALQMLAYWNAPASKQTTEHKLTPAAQREIKESVGNATESIKAQATGAEKRASPTSRRRG
jgi:mannose-P-dolichol utilization defect protein 1